MRNNRYYDLRYAVHFVDITALFALVNAMQLTGGMRLAR
jgi:hypothetical protein